MIEGCPEQLARRVRGRRAISLGTPFADGIVNFDSFRSRNPESPAVASRRKGFTPNHPIVITFLIIAIVASMSLAAEVLRPLALAVLLSFALAPVARFLQKRGLPKSFSVVLTVVLALGALGGIVFVVSQQLTSLAYDLPEYQDNINKQLNILHSDQETALERAQRVASDVASKLDEPVVERDNIQDVRVVSRPSFQERLSGSVGPYLEALGVGSFVLILVLFLLLEREDLADRITQLFGQTRITLTTRTMDEVGERISRYLAMFATVNSSIGLIVGVGLYLIGVPYAMLWGFLAAALRFIPYVGPTSAFLLPLVFSIAYFETWREPSMVIGLFLVLEIVANSFLEPIIYGKTTGVSALGLLVAAMFWTWLWGALGLLLSTPLTVCLAVLGKYVPSLGFFATLLGEETDLPRDVRYYQRLLALDQDGATAVIEEALTHEPRAAVLDKILIPALSRTERDFARDELDSREQAFIWRVTGSIVEDLEDELENILPTASTDDKSRLPEDAKTTPASLSEIKILGIASNDTGDAIVLKMLDMLVRPAGLRIEMITDAATPLQQAGRVSEQKSDLVVLSHLPPVGLTPARYLVRRLRAQYKDLPIVVGRWGESGDTASAAEQLTAAGASQVVFTLDDARTRLIAMATKVAEAHAVKKAQPSPVKV